MPNRTDHLPGIKINTYRYCLLFSSHSNTAAGAAASSSLFFLILKKVFLDIVCELNKHSCSVQSFLEEMK
jgi:hypothetical protein